MLYHSTRSATEYGYEQELIGKQISRRWKIWFLRTWGGADQNFILLDEAPVYNASHLLGFFSVFNSDAIKDVSIYKVLIV